MLELQITKEYLGQDTHLVYLAPLFKEVLDADTYARGPGSTGGAGHRRHRCDSWHRSPASPASPNIGDDRNWTGHPFNQANWYAFGRLAWDPGLAAGGHRRRVDAHDLHADDPASSRR